jgi:hypothetical protein
VAQSISLSFNHLLGANHSLFCSDWCSFCAFFFSSSRKISSVLFFLFFHGLVGCEKEKITTKNTSKITKNKNIVPIIIIYQFLP